MCIYVYTCMHVCIYMCTYVQVYMYARTHVGKVFPYDINPQALVCLTPVPVAPEV